MPTAIKLVVTFTILLGLNACGLKPVEPWDRDILAQKKMRLISDKLENYADDHIYFSKEASSGGQAVGGGGCGCN